MYLADRLGKTAAEIMTMTVVEFKHWNAYFNLMEEYRKAK